MRTTDLIRKAALLLDLRSDVPAALVALRGAVSIPSPPDEIVAAIEARVFLAEVLFEYGINPSEARAALEAARSLAAGVQLEPDLVAPLLARADRLISR